MEVALDNKISSNSVYTLTGNSVRIVDLIQKCRDEVIGVLKITKIANKLELNFERLSDYETEFVGLDSHDVYFNQAKTIEDIDGKVRGKVTMILESQH